MRERFIKYKSLAIFPASNGPIEFCFWSSLECIPWSYNHKQNLTGQSKAEKLAAVVLLCVIKIALPASLFQ